MRVDKSQNQMPQVMKEFVIKIIMKKVILILVVIITICGGYYFCYMQSNKKMLSDFAYDLNDNSVKLSDVIIKYIKCDKEGKDMSLYILAYYRKNNNENPSSIIVYSYYEEVKLDKGIENIPEDHDKVYFVTLNSKLKIPVLLNEESKIVAISFGLSKGERNYSFMRLDGKKD